MEVLMGQSSINGPFSMAMLNNQRVNVICFLLAYCIETAGEKVASAQLSIYYSIYAK
jgi:hypothetical protein